MQGSSGIGAAKVVFLSVAFGFLAGGAGFLTTSRLMPAPAATEAPTVTPAAYRPSTPVPSPVPAPTPAGAAGVSDPFVAAVAKAKPGVVQIYSFGMNRAQRRPWLEGPGEPQPQPQPGAPQQPDGTGSGFIVDAAKGLVLTNQHVIENAQQVKVGLEDGREMDAEVVGADRMSDVAVLRIPADNLPAIAVGNDTDLAVGQWVIAIGNPFGDFNQTVTVGVISGLGRSLSRAIQDDRNYRNLIQTDAAINMGNSGGPLCNLRGEVIGINSAIFSPGGVNIGLGFAIPIDDAQNIARHLIDHGGVPWLGVEMYDVDEEVAAELKLTVKEGVVIGGTAQGSPAATAGLQPDDVVVKLGDEPVKNGRDVELKILGSTIGQELEVTVLRAGKEKTLKVRLGTRPSS